MAETLRALVVAPPVLRRVVQAHRDLGLGAPVPHTHCYAIRSAELSALAAEADLEPLSALAGEGHVLLLASDLAHEPLARWRLTYHAAVHAAFDHKQRAGLLHGATLRDRIHRVGQTEFDEVRAVLARDEALLARLDHDVYAEFAALFLELAAFDPAALAATFPTVAEPERVLATLRLDVDHEALLASVRPADAPEEPYRETEEPGAPATVRPQPELAAHSTDAARQGRLAHAAVLEARASPDAPGAHLRALVDAAALATGLTGAEELARRLLPIARSGAGRAERVLYDVERAVRDHATPVRALRLGRSLLSFFRESPVVRLPCAEEARVVRHLARAVRRARRVPLRRQEKERVLHALEALHEGAQERLASAVRPRVEAALQAVGLVPRRDFEVPYGVKLTTELVHLVTTRGFFTLGELRDAISRNRIKVPRLSGAAELVRGDPLLLLDARLGRELDGLYRPGEIYLRGLEKLSALAFGTAAGAFVTRYLALPLLLSFVVLEGLSHLVGPLLAKVAGLHVHLLTPASFAGLSLFTAGVLHLPRFRALVLLVLRGVGAALGAVVRAPLALLGLPALRRLRRSALVRFGVRPLLLAGAAYLGISHLRVSPLAALGVAAVAFVVPLLLAATRLGRRVEDAAWELWARAGRSLGRNLLPGLVALVGGLFGAILEGTERGIHAVDEWLRLRGGDSRLTLWAKGLLSLVWGVLTYVVRLYLNVLVEPQVNPIKHFPVVTVSHKIILPMSPTLLGVFRAPLLPLGVALANTIGGATVFLLPGAFGFLVWELKENWKLYSQNQPQLLAPVAVGSHGETVRNLLVPGFHAGTIPKLYAKWRRAAVRKKPTEKVRHDLHHVEEALAAFVTSELLAVAGALAGLREAKVRSVHLASNRISVSIERGEAEAELVLEEQSGLVLASLSGAGLLQGLTPEDRARFENILAGFYRFAAVDVVRQQLEALLPAGLSYDVEARGLAVFREGEPWEAVYPLGGGAEALEASGPSEQRLPVLSRADALFGRTELSRDAWERALEGATGRLARGPSLLSGLG